MKLIAHGGYSAKYPENTLDSYMGALEYRPDGVEMDVVIFEGRLYCYHPKDAKNNYGSDVDLVIWDELRELKQANEMPLMFDLRNWVSELLNYSKFILLDLKQKGIEVLPEVVDVVKTLGLEKSQIVIGARDIERMELLKKDLEYFDVLALPQSQEMCIDFIESGADFIRLWEDELTQKWIDTVHELGKELWLTPGKKATPTEKRTAGEVTKENLLRYKEMGVDTILVNDIEMARNLIPND